MKTFKEKKPAYSLIALKLGAQEIVKRLIEELNEGKDVHIESLLGIVGALSGYACHAALREELIEPGAYTEQEVFTIVKGNDGRKYYLGNLAGEPMMQSLVSIWEITTGRARFLGAGPPPDIRSIAARVQNTLGNEAFGTPAIPDKHKPGDLPVNFVKTLWRNLRPLMDEYCSRPSERPLLLGYAAQQVMEMGKDVISPMLAAQLVMECAVPMSNIGPEWIEEASE